MVTCLYRNAKSGSAQPTHAQSTCESRLSFHYANKVAPVKRALGLRWATPSQCGSLGICAVIALLSCLHARGAESAAPFQPADYPERLARNVVHYDLSDPSKDNLQYVVTASDDIELYVVDKSETPERILTSRIIAVESVTQSPGTVFEKPYPLTKVLRRSRVPSEMFDLREKAPADGEGRVGKWKELRVETSKVTFVIDISSGAIAPGETRLGTFKNAVEKTSQDYSLRMRVLPRMRVYPLPGDRMILNRMEQQAVGDGRNPNDPHRPFPRIQQYEVVVDSQGYMWIPTVQTSVESRLNPSPVFRRRFSQLEGAFFRVQVAGRKGGSSPSVDEIAEALSSGEFQTNMGTSVDPDSHVFGRVHPDEENELANIRYVLSPPDLKWSLVARNGTRHEFPYENGLDMVAAVRNGIRVATGEAPTWSSTPATLIVVPDVKRNPSANRNPFVYEVGPSRQENVDGVILLPGDTVFVRD
jgi:hypothetical protein